MKVRWISLFSFSFLFFVSCINREIDQIQIKADIDGLVAGDTILFTRFGLPNWEDLETDTLIVKKEGTFVFTDTATQTRNYFIGYRPYQGIAPTFCKRGIVVYIRPNDYICLKGNTDCFVAAQRRGGLYDDIRLKDILRLEDSLDIKRNSVFRKLMYFNSLMGTENACPDSIDYYFKAYRSFDSKELDEMIKNYQDTVNDSEYAALLYMGVLYNTSYKEFKERFERFTPDVKNSTTGQSLAYMLKVKANIEPGNTPSAFTVTDKDGNQVSLSDYKGKYLLLYHWGVCPGTIWVHPRLLDLYEKYHDKGFEVLGFTKQEEELPASFRKDKATASLFNQPWRTVYTTQESNKFIADDYYFAGVPILMLISPEGKTIYRGYTDVYEPLKKLLEENL